MNSTNQNQKKAPGESSKLGLGWVAALVLVAFLLGFAVRGFVLPGAQSDLGTSTPTLEMPQNTGTTAPPLSEEQLQQGQMPEGHPPLGEEPTTPETPAPPTTTP